MHYYINEKEQLIKSLEKIHEKPAKIQKTYPYIFKEFLGNESKALQRTEELKRLHIYQAQTEDYKKQINAYYRRRTV